VCNGWDFDSYMKFIVVRNPWARLVSCHAAYANRGQPNPPRFREWLYNVKVDGDPVHPSGYFSCMSLQHVAGDGSGRLLVDHVLKLETLTTTLPPLLATVGIANVSMPHTNKTPHKHYTKFYRPRDVQHVANLYAEEIERFGYAFGQ